MLDLNDSAFELPILSVQDTGPGIPTVPSQGLFQPFFQVDGSMRRKFGGTGLGLYLSKKLVQSLGGDLELSESTVDQGSTFSFSIHAELAGALALPAQQEVRVFQINSKHRLKILVVDDIEDNRILITRLVSKMGCDVDQAKNGKEGIEKALHNPYDLVFMDIQMPEMDGFEAVAHLRQEHFGKPIIALTAHAMVGDREACLAKGFDDYLVKPINKASLYRTLEKYVSDPSL